ncbi:MAG: RNB domain-containing ribonuclease [Vicinamibacteria bacterium]|nr:RNB domain-containing ribonuclease [Vicinamibacteria bacterium]
MGSMTTGLATSRERLREIARRVMVQRGLRPDFPAEALAQLAAIERVDPAPGPGVRDLRTLAWASIDNDDSRDLDQLSVALPGPAGAVQLLVAIADVDVDVARDSALDVHARINTTSVYTAGGVFPMLPDELSTDRTSLNPDQDRIAVVVEMVVGPDGAVRESELSRAVVRNHAQLAYDGVAAWLDGDGSAAPPLASAPALAAQVRLQDRTAQAMKALRQQRGALTLETLETRSVFEGDELADLRPDPGNRAKELIENLMVAANEAAARYLESRGFPSLRRVLRVPARWDRLVSLAAAAGDALPAEPNAPALEQFLVRRRRADPQRFADLSLAVVKLLGSGEYALERPGQVAAGHFGLAARDYTHSTAPNRRYPDLVTQRLLKAALAGRPSPYGDDELNALARHCTVQEDNATKVERQVRKSAAALLLAPRVGERFDAMVTGASAKGTWARLFRPPVEGRIVRGFQGLDVGDHVQVKLVGTDVDRGFIDLVAG